MTRLLAAVLALLFVCAAGTSTVRGAFAQGPSGSIAGNVSFPSEGVPAMVIYAFPVDNSGVAYAVRTSDGDPTYAMHGLPVGVYNVVAYPASSPAGSVLAGGYTAAVVCGLQTGCDDHTLIPVTVTGGAMLTGIDVSDWYAPGGAYPPKPSDSM